MEDYIEILIYGLAILASLVGSIYRSQQKKKALERKKQMQQTSPDQSMTENEQNIPEDIFPPIFGEQPEVIFEEEPVFEEVVEPEKEPVYEELKKPETIETKFEGTAAFESTEEELMSDDLQEEGQEFDLTKELEEETKFEDLYKEEKSDFEFDPVKAVIYSEILSRKEY